MKNCNFKNYCTYYALIISVWCNSLVQYQCKLYVIITIAYDVLNTQQLYKVKKIIDFSVTLMSKLNFLTINIQC